MVICLTHLGFESDRMMVQRGLRNVDLIVGGHSHTFLKEICWEKGPDGVEIPIIQNGCWGLNMGNLKVDRLK